MVATNSAGRIIFFKITPNPVTEPMITGLKILPDVTAPVDIIIPSNIGVRISIVLTITLTESSAS